MALPSPAQREPSMEEILASIRRIIEDSDTEKRRESAGGAPVAAVAANDTEGQRSVETMGIETGDDALEDDGPSALVDELDEPVAAHLVAANADETAAAPQSETALDDDAEATGEFSMADVELAFAEAVNLDLDSLGDVGAGEAVAQAEAAPVADLPDDGATAAEMHENIAPAALRAPLVSEQAGRQVAAAFGELEAFAASRRRSFDEMAEEMLRPMLHDWLDNNLPYLVEKLVREEIERIARG